MPSHNALAIFLKTPDKHHVKTRLSTHFTAEEIVDIYSAFLKDLDNKFNNKKKYDTWYIISPDHFNKKRLSQSVRLNKYFLQEGDSLGDRMNHTFEVLRDKDYQKIVLVGSDIPILTEEIIIRALFTLDGADCVLGPTDDGGYYLIGLKRSEKILFEDIDWSTEDVLKQTLEKAQQNQIDTKMVSTLNDIDTFQDLQELKNMLERADKTAPDFPNETWNIMNKLELLR